MAASEPGRDRGERGDRGAVRRGRPRNPAVDESILAATLTPLGESGYAALTMEQLLHEMIIGRPT